MYEPRQTYATGRRVYQAGTRLRGSDEEVRARFGAWMDASLPDDEKAKLRAEASWSQVVVEDASRGPAPDPIAEPPTGRMRAVRSFRLADADLQHVAQVSVGQLVDASETVYRRYPHLFVQHVEDR